MHPGSQSVTEAKPSPQKVIASHLVLDTARYVFRVKVKQKKPLNFFEVGVDL